MMNRFKTPFVSKRMINRLLSKEILHDTLSVYNQLTTRFNVIIVIAAFVKQYNCFISRLATHLGKIECQG